jgi:hypothetical protein
LVPGVHVEPVGGLVGNHRQRERDDLTGIHRLVGTE